MNEEIELAWLRLTDKSQLVLTTRHVFQHQDYGIFGENRGIIPRHAITTVRIGWQRSRWAMLLGVILLVSSLALIVHNQINQGNELTFTSRLLFISSSTLWWLQYGLLAAGLALIALFWFHKRSEIHIGAVNGGIGGTPVKYEDAEEFCLLLMGAGKEPMPATPKAEPEPDASPKTTDRDWRL